LCWYIQHVSGEGPYRLEEVGKHARNNFQAATYNGVEENPETQEDYRFHCLRGQWVLTSGSKLRSDYENADDVRKPRRCAYYTGFQPGFGPEEHKELKRDQETRQAIVKASLIGAAIGASAAIIAQLLYIRLTTMP
jgi:hypothetical protein